MKYNRLHINHFGRLQNRTLEFGDGINIIYGANESGKSTLHAFLESMLFGMDPKDPASDDAFTRYYPLEGSSTYGGVLEFSQGGTLYSIYRNFQKDPQGYTLMDETHNRRIDPTEAAYQQIISQLTRPLYRNTLSVRQSGASVSGALAGQLKSRIVNLQSAGSVSIDVDQAQERLKKDRRQLELSYSRETEEEARELDERIAHLTEELDQMPAPPDSRNLEQENGALEEEIRHDSQRHEDLLREIERDELYVRHASPGEIDDLSDVEEDFETLAVRRQRSLDHHHGALSLPLRILLTLACLITLCAGISGLLFGAGFYLDGSLLESGIFFGAGVLALILFLAAFIRLMRSHSFRRNNRRILRLYRLVWNDAPSEVTNSSVRDFTAFLEDLTERQNSLAANREEDRTLTEQLLRCQDRLREIHSGLEEARHDIWQRDQREEALRGLQEEKDSLADALAENRRLSEEIAAVDLAAETLEQLSETAFGSFSRYLQDTASSLLSQITFGRYTRLVMDDDLNITLEHGDTPVRLESLSCSTLDQVYLSLRIACIRFFWPDEPMPLLLDESFAMYDSDRVAETLSWLSQSYPGQILLFTCQHREEEILDQNRIKYQVISL